MLWASPGQELVTSFMVPVLGRSAPDSLDWVGACAVGVGKALAMGGDALPLGGRWAGKAPGFPSHLVAFTHRGLFHVHYWLCFFWLLVSSRSGCSGAISFADLISWELL